MPEIKKFLVDMGRYPYSLLIRPFCKKINQKVFYSIRDEMRESYRANKEKYDFMEFVLAEWQSNMFRIEDYFLNDFPFLFLNHDIIKKTMFVYSKSRWKNIQKKFIGEHLSKNEAKEILREYNVGKPLLNDLEYTTSGNNIHHLYHLLKFSKETNTKISELNNVVEVGGGYGNLAKIYKKLNRGATYTIIDIPIFSYIQAVYLKTILGRDAVHLLQDSDTGIKKGLINIIPLDKKTLRRNIDILKDVDLFISTWALSESNKAMQDYIKEAEYFKTKYLLLAYQKSSKSFAFAENVTNIPKEYRSIFNRETEYIKDNFYLFSALSPK